MRHCVSALASTPVVLASFCLVITPPAAGQSLDEFDVVELFGSESNANFGRVVAGLGDVNGNGHEDFAISAPYMYNGAGAVFIYFGSPDLFESEKPPVPDVILSGLEADDQFGISVAGKMDLNGNGHADIAIGARFSDLGESNAGAVFVYFGGSEIGPEPDLILLGEAADDWFGQSVSRAGDVNGSGYDDLIVGAPFNDENANAAGKAYIYFGGAEMNDQPDLELFGAPVAHAHFGWSVSGGGDVSGNGFDDVLVGARLHGVGPNQGQGRAYLFHGNSPMDTEPDLILEGAASNEWFGESVAVAGDVSGNGHSDLVIGAIFAGGGQGRASIFFGGPNMNATPDYVLSGPTSDAQLGNAVAGLDDVNGTGRADVIIGAKHADTDAGFAAGQAFVVFGNRDLEDEAVDLVLSGEGGNDQFGISVSSAGFVADGAPAFLVGAHHNSDAAPAAGKAFLFRLDEADEPGIPGDLTGDGSVGVPDLLILINSWGPCADCDDCPADLTDDCTVGVPDLLILINNWG